MDNKTAMSDLLEKCNSMIEDNAKYKSQFHKGLLHAFGMVKYAIESKLIKDEKNQVINDYIAGFYAGCDQPLLDTMPKNYYENTYQITNK